MVRPEDIRNRSIALEKVAPDIALFLIPSGGIIMWSGPYDQIPSGFVLCDGENGTPNLRGRFVVGAGVGSGYSVGARGGEDAVALTTDGLPSHNHEYYSFALEDSATTVAAGEDVPLPIPVPDQQTTTTTGSGSPHENRPPYYALCFIMKT